VRRQLWWLLPLTAIWLVGMWMATLYLQTEDQAFVVRTDSGVSSVTTLTDGDAVGVTVYSSGASAAEERLPEGAVLIGFDDEDMTVAALESGDVVAIVEDLPSMEVLVGAEPSLSIVETYPTSAPPWAVIVILVGNIVTFAISAFVGIRRPEVRIGQLFTLATAGFAVSPFLLPDVVEFMPNALVRPLAVGGALLSSLALASVGLLIALFPDGHHTSRRWRWLSWYAAAFVVVFTPLSVREFATADLDGATPFPAALSDAMFLAGMFAFLAALVSLGFRFRRGDRETRAQLGWLFYAVSIYALFLIVSGPIGIEESIVGAALDQIFYVPIPVAIAIAVLRYRLYEIDRVVSRTVSYTLVVGAMVGVYAGVISLIHVAVPLEEDLAVAISTLVAVAISVPLVRRVRDWVDRRFFRSHYDAASVVARVAYDLRTTVDLAEVERRAGAVVDEVFAPESVGVWLAEEAT
jgi:hypothetical protein